MPRVVEVRTLEPFKVWLRFSDRAEGVVDLGEVFARGGVFEPLRDPREFAKVRLARGFGTIEWPGGVDLDPDALYARLTGLPIDEVPRRD
ncbi:MAG: DUF2442 domain-containing protein [Thermoanaerobaculia bacterium]